MTPWECDKENIEEMAKRFPRKAIYISHQFMQGTAEDPYPYGFVPNDWDGETICIYRADYAKRNGIACGSEVLFRSY